MMEVEWISVKDRLPDDERLKAIRYADNFNKKHLKHLGMKLSRYFYSNHTKRKQWCFEYMQSQHVEVTHWCDIPEFEG